MEFLDGFDIATNVLGLEETEDDISLDDETRSGLIYAYHNLHKCGYLHKDAHFGNIMIKRNSNFFKEPSIEPNKRCGEIKIIDFGRSVALKPATTDAITTNWNDATELLNREIIGSYILNIGENMKEKYETKLYQHASYLIYDANIYNNGITELLRVIPTYRKFLLSITTYDKLLKRIKDIVPMRYKSEEITDDKFKSMVITQNNDLRDKYVMLSAMVSDAIKHRFYPIGYAIGGGIRSFLPTAAKDMVIKYYLDDHILQNDTDKTFDINQFYQNLLKEISKKFLDMDENSKKELYKKYTGGKKTKKTIRKTIGKNIRKTIKKKHRKTIQ